MQAEGWLVLSKGTPQKQHRHRMMLRDMVLIKSASARSRSVHTHKFKLKPKLEDNTKQTQPNSAQAEYFTKMIPHAKSILPTSYIPAQHTVVIGKGKICTQASGNKYLVEIVQRFRETYSKARTKNAKTVVVTEIVQAIEEACRGEIPFVKFHDGLWYEMDEAAARTKVGSCLRDALFSKYKSSTKLRVEKRRAAQKKTKRCIFKQSRSLSAPVLPVTSLSAPVPVLAPTTTPTSPFAPTLAPASSMGQVSAISSACSHVDERKLDEYLELHNLLVPIQNTRSQHPQEQHQHRHHHQQQHRNSLLRRANDDTDPCMDLQMLSHLDFSFPECDDMDAHHAPPSIDTAPSKYDAVKAESSSCNAHHRRVSLRKSSQNTLFNLFASGAASLTCSRWPIVKRRPSTRRSRSNLDELIGQSIEFEEVPSNEFHFHSDFDEGLLVSDDETERAASI